MSVYKFLKRRLFFLLFCIAAGVCIFNGVGDSKARGNAYIACFIDDTSFMYKTQVIYSNAEIEASRISILSSPGNLFDGLNALADVDYRTLISDSDIKYSINPAQMEGDYSQVYSRIRFPKDKYGRAVLDMCLVDSTVTADTLDVFFTSGENSTEVTTNYIPVNPIYFEYGIEDASNIQSMPLTFPGTAAREADSADINRAYAVQDTIYEDFKDALLYINDGKKFTSVDALIETSYYLCLARVNINAPDEGYKITNMYGHTYTVKRHAINEYTKTVSISSDDGISEPCVFVESIKKGYVNTSFDEVMEDGTLNKLNTSDLPAYEPEWITWGHLFYEAGILYAQGISYANQADIFTLEGLESSLVTTLRNLLSGARGYLQLFEMEECIFNKGIRGSSAFAMGVYNNTYSTNVMIMYLISVSIALCLVMASLVKLIMDKQRSTISSIARVSLMDGTKNLILALMLISLSWVIVRLLFLINYKFVGIFSALIGDMTLADRGGYSTLAGILYQFTFFVINIYINFVYIIRGLLVPFLIIVSPVFIMAMSFGSNGSKVTGAWFKEFLGTLFIQSFHALVYGFILLSSGGLRGIESIVVCASIIPLTSTIKDITGVGGDKLFKQASSLTSSSVALGSQALATTAGAVGSVASLTGGAIGGAVGGYAGSMIGSGIGNIAGGALTSVSGAASLGLGSGLQFGLSEESNRGSQIASSGTSQMSAGVNMASRGMRSSVMAPAVAKTVTSVGGRGVNGSSGPISMGGRGADASSSNYNSQSSRYDNIPSTTPISSPMSSSTRFGEFKNQIELDKLSIQGTGNSSEKIPTPLKQMLPNPSDVRFRRPEAGKSWTDGTVSYEIPRSVKNITPLQSNLLDIKKEFEMAKKDDAKMGSSERYDSLRRRLGVSDMRIHTQKVVDSDGHSYNQKYLVCDFKNNL